MAKKTNGKTKSTDHASVDQIREIIFGQHIRTYEKRFDDLEQKLDDAIAAIQKSIEEQFSAMHKYAGENFDAAKDGLAAESRARDSDMGKMENNIQKLHMDSENQLASVEGQLGQSLNDLQKELNQTHKELVGNAEKNFNSLSKSLDAQGAKLDKQKVDRKELASFLNVMAGQMVGTEGTEE